LFVVKEDAAPSVNRFIDFVLSAKGDRILRASGAVPFTASEESIE
jgi:ABC-type molybdate transport system substrate-binding protein